MKILALDSSAAIASVALCEDEQRISEFSLNNRNRHSETLLPMIEDLLKRSGSDLSDVDLFAVSHGPGSFTGVRIGISLVKGLAFGSGKPCIGVSALEALAYSMEEVDGLICPMIDARRGQVYNALFRSQDGALVRSSDDRLILLSDLVHELSTSPMPVFGIGDAYDSWFAAMQESQAKIGFTPPPIRQMSAYGVARAAFASYRKGIRTSDRELVPIYLRPTQAERERNEHNPVQERGSAENE